jgi:hypothetical protein
MNPVRDLQKLPKVDLHVHLECSIRRDTLRLLAGRNRVDLPSSLTAEEYKFHDFEDFRNAVHSMRHPRLPELNPGEAEVIAIRLPE